jgi:hypothetical protein
MGWPLGRPAVRVLAGGIQLAAAVSRAASRGEAQVMRPCWLVGMATPGACGSPMGEVKKDALRRPWLPA